MVHETLVHLLNRQRSASNGDFPFFRRFSSISKKSMIGISQYSYSQIVQMTFCRLDTYMPSFPLEIPRLISFRWFKRVSRETNNTQTRSPSNFDNANLSQDGGKPILNFPEIPENSEIFIFSRSVRLKYYMIRAAYWNTGTIFCEVIQLFFWVSISCKVEFFW